MRNVKQQIVGFAALALLAGIVTAAAQSPPANPPVRVRGTVEKLDGNTLMVKTREGQDATIKLPDNYRVLGLTKITIADVKAGDYVGITSTPQTDGTQKAIHVHIFPEPLRGVAEGHYPWDSRPGAMMTNATVNTTVTGNDGQTLTVKYKTGEQKVLVPADAIILKYVAAEKAELKPGAKIIIMAAQKQPDGSFTTANVSVGLNGLTPPM
jgi:hypothetical protein